MKKLLEKIMDSKVLGGIVDVLVDVLPLGTTVRKLVKWIRSKVWADENQDGDIQFSEIRFEYPVAVAAIALLMRFDVISKEFLLEAAELILSILGGS